MATTEIQVAYDSEDQSVHTMDVEQLGPSLIALGTLCKRANAILNGDRATVRVLVESDFEHKCFLISFQIVQDIYSQVQSLLHNHDVKTSKEILEWLGLVESAIGAFGLFKYLKEKRGRKPDSVQFSDKEGTVELQFDAGQNNKIEKIVINQHVYQLSQDRSVIASVKGVLQPTQSPGISAVEFREHGRLIETVHKKEAAEIIARELIDTEPDSTGLKPQVIDARLTIYSPVFDQDSRMWKFIYGGRVVRVDIHDSGIAEDVMRRGAISIGDAYLVKLEITEHKTENGYRNTYRALSWSQFLPASPGSAQGILDLIERSEDGDGH